MVHLSIINKVRQQIKDMKTPVITWKNAKTKRTKTFT